MMVVEIIINKRKRKKSTKKILTPIVVDKKKKREKKTVAEKTRYQCTCRRQMRKLIKYYTDFIKNKSSMYRNFCRVNTSVSPNRGLIYFTNVLSEMLVYSSREEVLDVVNNGTRCSNTIIRLRHRNDASLGDRIRNQLFHKERKVVEEKFPNMDYISNLINNINNEEIHWFKLTPESDFIQPVVAFGLNRNCNIDNFMLLHMWKYLFTKYNKKKLLHSHVLKFCKDFKMGYLESTNQVILKWDFTDGKDYSYKIFWLLNNITAIPIIDDSIEYDSSDSDIKINY
jgi:hypothetical protein